MKPPTVLWLGPALPPLLETLEGLFVRWIHADHRLTVQNEHALKFLALAVTLRIGQHFFHVYAPG